jgi:hypothetical protein
MKRLSDILKEAMTPGFEKAFASTPKGVEVHMKHKETGKIVKTKFLGTHSAVAAAKKHINDMQGKGYTVHAKKLIEEVEQLGELKTSTLLSYHSKSQKSAAELGNKASKEMDAGNMKKASALLKQVSKRQKSQSQAMGKIQKRYANLKDEVEHTNEAKKPWSPEPASSPPNPKDADHKKASMLIDKIRSYRYLKQDYKEKGNLERHREFHAKLHDADKQYQKLGHKSLLRKDDHVVEEVEQFDEAIVMPKGNDPHSQGHRIALGSKEMVKKYPPGSEEHKQFMAGHAAGKEQLKKRMNSLEPKIKSMGEETSRLSLLEILREMAKRGRPKKNPSAPAPSKMSKDDDEEENEEPDTGPEADKNITVQLKKAADQAVHGEKGGADIEFADGKKHFVHGHVAHKVLNAMEKMKPAQRAEAQKGIHQSHAHLMAVHKMLSR